MEKEKGDLRKAAKLQDAEECSRREKVCFISVC